MADDVTTVVPETGDDFEPGDEPDTEKKAKPDKASDGLKADLAKERDKRQEAERRLKEIEDAGKPKDQLRNEEFEALKSTHAETASERDTLKGENLRLKVALQKGLPWKLAARLQGADEKELAADADELLSEFGGAAPKKKPSFNGGARDSGPADENDMNAVIARAARSRR